MKLPPDLLQRLPEQAVRMIALGFLDEIEAAAPRLRDESDVEALHDWRVGVRRLRSSLGAWRALLKGSAGKKQRRALRDLQSETGTSRDLEVAHLWVSGVAKDAASGEEAGLRWILERLRRGYEAGMDGVRERVLRSSEQLTPRLRRRFERCEVNLDLSEAEPHFSEALRLMIEDHATELLEHLAHVDSAADRDEMHEARIQGKRLRYLLEPMRGIVDGAVEGVRACKKLQDVLGDLNDVHVQREYLGEARLEAGREPEAEGLSPGLDLLQRAMDTREAGLFERLQKRWLVDDAASLRAVVAHALDGCAITKGEDREIERKYLLSAAPDAMPAGRVVKIEQGWLPGDRLRERVRRRTEDGVVTHVRTIKLGRGVERFELEEETSAEVFDVLWSLTEGCRVQKVRTIVPQGTRAWEIDAFLDREGLHLAEIELDSADEEVHFPGWLAPFIVREVTEEKGFTNLELAL